MYEIVMLRRREISLEESERRGFFSVLCLIFSLALKQAQTLDEGTFLIANEVCFKIVDSRELSPEEKKAIKALKTNALLRSGRTLNVFRSTLLTDWTGTLEWDGISGTGFFQLLRETLARNRNDIPTSYERQCEGYITEFEVLLNQTVDKTETLLNNFLLSKYTISLHDFTQNPERLNSAAWCDYNIFQQALAMKFIVWLRTSAASGVEISRRMDSLDDSLTDFYNKSITNRSTYVELILESRWYQRLRPIHINLPERASLQKSPEIFYCCLISCLLVLISLATLVGNSTVLFMVSLLGAVVGVGICIDLIVRMTTEPAEDRQVEPGVISLS